MFQFLLCLQVICVLAGIYCVATLIHFRLGKDARLLILATVMICIASFGYLLEMLSDTKEAAIVSLMVQYLGLCFMAMLFSMFLCEYCQKKTPRRIWILATALDSAFLLYALTATESNTFYKSLDWVETGLAPHLKCTAGPGFIAFVSLQAVYLLLSAIVTLSYREKVTRRIEKKRVSFLFLACMMPFVGVFLHHVVFDSGYNPVTLLVTVSCIYLTYILTHWKMVNVVNRAFSSLFMDIEQGVIVADADKHFLESNTSADVIFPEMRTWDPGISLDELGVDLCVFGRTEPFERDGRWYVSLAKPIIEQRKQVGYLIIIEDVTVVQSQMEEMRELKEAADNANNAKSAFLANMSHEIRTPLNAIIGMAELAERENEVVPIKDYLTQIKSAGKMLLDIICETLDLSKAESGKLDIVPVEFDTAGLLNGVINVINMRIGDKDVKFNVDVDPMIPTKLFGDDIRIRQIMINFLGNAEKFTQQGHITFRVGFDILEARKISLLVDVEDTGSGISREDMGKLFQPFSQVDMKKNRKIVGTGLGLAISAELIKLMEGEAKVQSEYGKGSTFSFAIPVEVLDPTPMAPNATRTVLETSKYSSFNLYSLVESTKDESKDFEDIPKYPKAKVLVVDDNKVNVKVLCAFLKQFDIEPDTCYCGPDAIKKAEEKDYDLIFMDHMMPDMDGAEAASWIRKSGKEWNRKVPIVACSANVMKGADELFLESGMDDYISKPVQLATLKKKINKYLKS